MIWIEKPLYDREKFCLNCNRQKDDTKDLKFSVGNNDSTACVISLCKECRAKLKSIL